MRAAGVFAIICGILPFAAEAITVASPSNGAVIVAPGHQVVLTPGSVEASTARTDWYVEGKYYCSGYAPPWTCEWQAWRAGDSGSVPIYVVSKNMFGVTLSTSTTVTVSTKIVGPSITFTLPSSNCTPSCAGDIQWDVNLNYGRRLIAGVDGRVSQIGAADWTSTNTIANTGCAASAASFPCTITLATIHTARFRNGLHEFYLTNRNNDATSQIMAHQIATSDVNTTTGAITENSHPMRACNSTTGCQTVTLTTTGTLPAGLSLATTYYVIYVDANSYKLASSQANALVGTAIIPSDQGSGTHTVSYFPRNPFWVAGQDGYSSHFSQIVDLENGSAAMEIRPKYKDVWLYLTGGPTTVSLAPWVENVNNTTTTVATSDLIFTTGNSAVATCSSTGVVTAVAVGNTTCTVSDGATASAADGMAAQIVRVHVEQNKNWPHFSNDGVVRNTYSSTTSLIPRMLMNFSTWGYNRAGTVLPDKALKIAISDYGVNTVTEGVATQLADSVSKASWDSYWTNDLWNAINTYTNETGAKIWFWNYEGMWPPWTLASIMSNRDWDRKASFRELVTNARSQNKFVGMTGADEFDGLYGAGDYAHEGTVSPSGPFTKIVVLNGVWTIVDQKLATINMYVQSTGLGNWARIKDATTAGLNGYFAIVPASKTFATGDITVGPGAGQDQITITSHGYWTGKPAVISSSTTLPGGLTTGLPVWIAVIDANTIKLATAAALAATCASGTTTDCIDLISQGAGTHTITTSPVKDSSGGANNSVTYAYEVLPRVSVADGTYDSTNNSGMKAIAWAWLASAAQFEWLWPGTASNTRTTYRGWDGTFTQIAVASNVATVSLTSHGLSNGLWVRVHTATGCDTDLHGIYPITTAGANSFTFPTTNVADTGGSPFNSSLCAGLRLSVLPDIDNDFLKNIKTELDTVAPGIAMSYPILGQDWAVGTSSIRLQSMLKIPTVANSTNMYTTAAVQGYYGKGPTSRMNFDTIVSRLMDRRSDFTPPALWLGGLVLRYTKQVAGYNYQPGMDLLGQAGAGGTDLLNVDREQTIFTNILAPFALGASGVQLYQSTVNLLTSRYTNPIGTGAEMGFDPLTQRTYTFKPIGLAFNFLQRMERCLLQPRIHAPFYGDFFYSVATDSIVASDCGRFLMVGSLSEMSLTETVDFADFKFTGGKIWKYQLKPTGVMTITDVSASSTDTAVFGAADVIAYVFQPTGAPPFVETMTWSAPNFPAGATKAAIQIAYVPSAAQDADGLDCTSGCSILVDRNGPWWVRRTYLDSSNILRYASDPERMQAR